jgi:hypothetical protein
VALNGHARGILVIQGQKPGKSRQQAFNFWHNNRLGKAGPASTAGPICSATAEFFIARFVPLSLKLSGSVDSRSLLY